MLKTDNKWDVVTMGVIEYTSTSFDRMNPLKQDPKYLNIKWFNAMNAYLTKLDEEQLFALKAYTSHGDKLVNNHVRGTLDVHFTIRSFQKNKPAYIDRTFFPLFFPVLSLIHTFRKNRKAISFKPNDALKRLYAQFNRGTSYRSKWDRLPLNDRQQVYSNMLDAVVSLDPGFVVRAIDLLAKTIDTIVRNSPKTTEKMVLYRGDDNDQYFKRNTGDVFFKIKGLISTSLSKEVGMRFLRYKNMETSTMCCMNKITVLPGSRVLFLGGMSNWPDEMEFLLPRS